VLEEIRLAVTKVYKIVEVQEVYEYDVTQYNRASGEGGRFVQYINTLLKLKAEASGYPSWVQSPTDEDMYIEEFRQSEGILLYKESI
jgi:hypothetical protein